MGRNRGINSGSAKLRAVWERDAGVCRYCGYPAECVDHIEPFSFNADSSLDNLALACARCNTIAGGQYFPTFEVKRHYILLKRRPEMARDARRWADE